MSSFSIFYPSFCSVSLFFFILSSVLFSLLSFLFPILFFILLLSGLLFDFIFPRFSFLFQLPQQRLLLRDQLLEIRARMESLSSFVETV